MPPAHREEQVKYPAVLNIHGGPEVSYVYDFWFELQMLAASGMAVVYCNPRGSSGYGTAFQADAYGDEPMDDLSLFLMPLSTSGILTETSSVSRAEAMAGL